MSGRELAHLDCRLGSSALDQSKLRLLRGPLEYSAVCLSLLAMSGSFVGVYVEIVVEGHSPSLSIADVLQKPVGRSQSMIATVDFERSHRHTSFHLAADRWYHPSLARKFTWSRCAPSWGTRKPGASHR